eukprot:1181520-Prorocentrum_minimum.AAC.2
MVARGRRQLDLRHELPRAGEVQPGGRDGSARRAEGVQEPHLAGPELQLHLRVILRHGQAARRLSHRGSRRARGGDQGGGQPKLSQRVRCELIGRPTSRKSAH